MNNKIRNLQEKILSKFWKPLKLYTFEYYRSKDEKWIEDKKEVYERGDATTALLYNIEKQTIILTKQFRLPTFLNGNDSGMLLETCAGMIDNENPIDAMRREIQEETGYNLGRITKIFEAYTSPGAITEIIHFYVAEYNDSFKESDGGGLEEENEEIEIVELLFEDALRMVIEGTIKDLKTISLLQYAALNKIMLVSK